MHNNGLVKLFQLINIIIVFSAISHFMFLYKEKQAVIHYDHHWLSTNLPRIEELGKPHGNNLENCLRELHRPMMADLHFKYSGISPLHAIEINSMDRHALILVTHIIDIQNTSFIYKNFI